MRIIMMIMLCLFLAGCTGLDNEKTSNPAEQQTTPQDLLRVHFIDVGQGDSILIESPNEHYMLIDGGTQSAGQEVVEYLGNQNIDKLDYVVATHPDADHIGGLIPVLKNITIENFIDSGKAHTSKTYEEMLTLIQSKEISFDVAQSNERIPLDPELEISVLHADEKAQENNEASIVLKVEYDDVSFLLTADAGIATEEKMMATEDVSATILKAGHHGSNTSSSLEFIEAVRPEATILSYGQDNTYGHPHFEVIEHLQEVGSKIYGTAEAGTIVVTTDGKRYNVLANEWVGIGATSSIAPPPKSNADNDKGKQESPIRIESVDLEGEIVAIANHGKQSVNMKGWQLLSTAGDQLFNFPNISIGAGQKIYITSGSDAKEGNGYIKWTGRQIWLNDGDTAHLINPKGEVVSER